MVNTIRVNADHRRDFHPHASILDHMTNLQTFTKGDSREISAFPFSPQLMFDQTLINLIVCLMISQKVHTKVARRASILQLILVDTNCEGAFKWLFNRPPPNSAAVSDSLVGVLLTRGAAGEMFTMTR